MIITRDAAKLLFEQNDMPDQAAFWNLLDSIRFKSEIISVNDVSSAYATTALVDGDTINWDGITGNIATLILSVGDGAKTLNITNMVANRFYVLQITRDGAGGAVTITLPANHFVFNAGGGVLECSTMANARDMAVGFYNGTNTQWSFAKHST